MIWNSVSESIARSSAETTPTDSDCGSPNGEPIAATGAPTCTWLRVPSGSGRSVRPLRVDLEQRDVGVRVGADDLGRHLVAVGELHVDLVGAADLAALAGGDDVRVGGDLAVAVRRRSRSRRRPGRRCRCRPGASQALVPNSDTTVTTPGASSLVDRRGSKLPRRSPSSGAARRLLEHLHARGRRLGLAALVQPPPPPQPAPAAPRRPAVRRAASCRQLQREGGRARARSAPSARRSSARPARARSRGRGRRPARRRRR